MTLLQAGAAKPIPEKVNYVNTSEI